MSLPLTVYKASAGSGKTFRLAVEYIKLLIVNPMSYRNILAVTFTNKATEEMKMRILSQLYGIWKHLTDSDIYLNTIVHELNISQEEACEKAGVALSLLIHNFSYFHVETIDSFFQSVLRNLARELDLTANLRIELNDYQVEEQAVDQLIESLTSTDQVLQWIISYAHENIADDKGWNIIGQVKSFGKTIFQDYYKESSASLNEFLSQPRNFVEYTKNLRQIRKEAADTMNSIAERFFDTLESNGITSDMLVRKKNGIFNYFKKLRGDDWSDKNCVKDYLSNCLESADNWVTKTSKTKALVIPVVEESLLPLLREAEQKRNNCWRLYLSADLTLRHLNQLRLLGTIEQSVRQINAEANRFLLSDTQQLLNELIGKDDSSFIFEKIGTQLEHIMIDEFQDMSTVQWRNFLQLLVETMSRSDAHDNGTVHNLIVGDVKQSIYRWRSGDWRLLNDIDSQFTNSEKLIEHKTLLVNRRSARNIITFNNHFFEEAAKHEQATETNLSGGDAQQIGKAYAQVLQEIPSEKKEEGYVKICLLDSTNYLENTLQQLATTISQLLEKGISANKMAILVRVNSYIPIIANYLMEQLPDVKLVSDEAFSLDASVGVNILIMALQLLAHPDDILTKASLVKYYQRNVLESTSTDAELFEQTDNLDNLLPHEFVSNSLQLRIKPLYELCEDLNSMFQLSKMTNESAYLCTFFDVLSAFTQETSADIDAFLNEWEEDYHKQNIQSDEIDGIRMISIHKSKGLEFDNLLIPFCDWQLEKTRDNILWCEPTVEGFDRLPLAPIDYSAKLLESIYYADYREEHLQNTVDNLNLLYVAFTRASKNLFVWGLNNGSGRRSNIISTILPNLQKQLTNATLTSSEKCPMLFEYGELLVESHSEKKENTTDNVFLKPISTEHITVETFAPHAEFRQSNKSREFVSVTDDDEQSKQQSYIKTGNILHKLFSAIHTADDIDEALRQLEFEGILNDGGISSDSLRKMLHKRLSHPLVAEWFSPKWTLFNECTILDFNPTTHTARERRPDRVMTDGEQMIVVDFKFGKPNNEYKQQVAEYMQLLAQMGYHNIKGYLWYVYTNTIEEVK